MEDFSISYIKKNQDLKVLRSGGLDVASSLPMHWTINRAHHNSCLLDKFGVIRGPKWFSQNLKILFQEKNQIPYNRNVRSCPAQKSERLRASFTVPSRCTGPSV